MRRRSKFLYGEEQYIVEAIVGHRWVNGKIEYNVKWAPIDGVEQENSYEPAHFIDPSIIRTYSAACHRDPIMVTIDVVPFIGMILRSIARAVTLAKLPCRPRVHHA